MMIEAVEIRCVSCGVSITPPPKADVDEFVRLAAATLRMCPRRYVGHPAFGFEARWRLSVYSGRRVDNGRFLEVGWTDSSWGKPFNLDAVPERDA